MVSFVVYDLMFLVIFSALVALFLYRRRSNLQRQGLLYLYRTKVGIKFIDWAATKYKKILKPLEYVILGSGYILMVFMIYMLGKFTYIYTVTNIATQIKIPPILPLFPYATDLFDVPFLPPFYFTYWIIIIAIIAVSHEFAHGIIARLNNIKVHSTGFGFLGPFLAAFVEPDEKHMEKASKFTQLSVLAAGTFANVLMTILFGLIMWMFFALSFSPAGVNFNAYPQAEVALGAISLIDGVPIGSIDNIPNLIDDDLEELNEITVDGVTYLVPGENLIRAIEADVEGLRVFEDAPAVKVGLDAPILEFDGVEIISFDELGAEIRKHEPGELVNIKTLDEDDEVVFYDLELGEKDGEAYLGIGVSQPSTKGFSGYVYGLISKVKDPLIYYAPNWGGGWANFIYDLLWWTVLINISVALVNMLPVGIFDGGRFFYLTVWGLTGSEKIGKRAFSWATWIIILILIWLMVKWALAFF